MLENYLESIKRRICDKAYNVPIIMDSSQRRKHVARAYEEAVDHSYLNADPDMKKFVELLRKEIESEYQEVFGLGDVVSQRREELRISQTELSRQTGVSQADISRLEQGKGNPTLSTITKVMQALQLKMVVQRSEIDLGN